MMSRIIIFCVLVFQTIVFSKINERAPFEKIKYGKVFYGVAEGMTYMMAPIMIAEDVFSNIKNGDSINKDDLKDYSKYISI